MEPKTQPKSTNENSEQIPREGEAPTLPFGIGFHSKWHSIRNDSRVTSGGGGLGGNAMAGLWWPQESSLHEYMIIVARSSSAAPTKSPCHRFLAGWLAQDRDAKNV